MMNIDADWVVSESLVMWEDFFNLFIYVVSKVSFF